MAITNTEITSFTLHKGGNRAKALYTFDSGQPVERRIRNAGANEAEALSEAVARIPDVELSAASRDAERASQGDTDISANGQASIKDVAKHRIKSFVNETDSRTALRMIRRIVSFIQAQGWTAAQIKNQLSISDAQWLVITTKRDYLLANQVAIDAYVTVQNGVPE